MVKVGFRETRRLPPEKVIENPRIENFPVIKPTVGWAEIEPLVLEGVLAGDIDAMEELRQAAQKSGIPSGTYDLCRFYGGGHPFKFAKRPKKEKEGMPTIYRGFQV